MTEQNRFDPIDEQPTEINCQRGLEKFSELVLLFILEVLKARISPKQGIAFGATFKYDPGREKE